MNREQMSDFLEAYRDGVIDESGAVELARTIQAGGEDAEWIMQELALSGWIQQALQQLDGESFLRSFLSRLYAERGGEEFSRAFSLRLAAETRKIKLQEIQESRLGMPFRNLLGANTATNPADACRAARRPGFNPRLLALAAFCLAIIAGGLLYLYKTGGGSEPAGTFLEATPGVEVVSKEQRRSARAGGEVMAGDSVTVPLNGHAMVNDTANGRWRLHAGSTVRFTSRGEPDGGFADVRTAPGIVLQRGILAGEVARPAGGIAFVATPHALVEFNDPVIFSLSVTENSTYAEVDLGSVILTRRADRKAVELPQGFYAVAADGSEFEPLKK